MDFDQEGYRWKFRNTEKEFTNVLTTKVGINSKPTIQSSVVKFPTAKEATWSTSHGRLVRSGALHSDYGVLQPNIGGAFYNEKTYVSIPNIHLVKERYPGIPYYQKFSGFPIPRIMPNTYPPLGLISNLALSGYGNTARSRVDPSNPSGNLLVGIGELFNEGLPALSGVQTWKNRANLYRGSGSEYLNVEFGWKPFLAEIRATAQSVKDAGSLLRQRERNVARPIRRRYNFPRIHNETVTKSGNNGTMFPSYLTNFGFPSTKLVTETVLDWDVWFSGAFSYFVSPGLSASRFARYEAQANAILGTRLTPEVLWNLSPWTWAVDWHVDFGAMLGNLSNQVLNGSVMWYGYVMSRQEKTVTEYRENASPYWVKSHHVIQQRMPATPFGFGLDPNTDYSASQTAILLALGLTRM